MAEKKITSLEELDGLTKGTVVAWPTVDKGLYIIGDKYPDHRRVFANRFAHTHYAIVKGHYTPVDEKED